MLSRSSSYNLYFRVALAVLLVAGGFAVGHGLKIVGITFAAWTAWTVFTRRGRVTPSVRDARDR